MDGDYEQLYHELETKHWWFSTRRALWMRLLRAFSSNSVILEIGCSGGPLLKQLNEAGFREIRGIDISEKAIEKAHQSGFKNASVMDAHQLVFEDNTFDIIIASDVLEHLEGEHKALSEWRRVLKPGGTLLVGVPAFKLLWSHHDVINHHQRRYTVSSLLNALKKAGFEVSYHFYWNSLLFIPRLFFNLLNKRRPEQSQSSHLFLPHPWVNTVLTLMMMFENLWVTIFYASFLPFGISIIASAKKGR
jgi:ubiquinone/menaquinone biosynthesis C-methylase UbiE